MGKSRADERRSARSSVMLTAEIEFDDTPISVRVANLSAHGALVLGDIMSGEDKPIIFRCSGLAAKGWIAWISPPYAGINFDVPIEPKALLPKTHSESDVIIRDTRELDFRRPGFRGNQMSDEERQIVEQWNREQIEESARKRGRPQSAQERLRR